MFPTLTSLPMLMTMTLCLICYESMAGTTSDISSTTKALGSSSDNPSTTSSTALMSALTSPPTTNTTPKSQKVTLCFQCAASGPHEPCVKDIAGMANYSTNGIYLKNCTATNPSWTRCMIQYVKYEEKYTFFHRDCHDGKYFPPELNSSRFANLPPNNESTCDNIAGKTVCYQPCDTDFCNGPTLIPKPNETDPCRDYFENPYDVTQGPDQICAVPGVWNKSNMLTTIFLGFVMSLIATDWASVHWSS